MEPRGTMELCKVGKGGRGDQAERGAGLGLVGVMVGSLA